MTIQSAACAPSGGGASTRCAHFSSAYERGIHECGAAGADSVDTYVSSKILRKLKNFATREPTILMGRAPACQRTCAYATFALLSAATMASSEAYGVWSPPKVFHTCAKTCGKWCPSTYRFQKSPFLWTLFEGESLPCTI